MRRIFVVDDEPDVVELLRTILEAEGFEVEATTDGGTALPWILDRPPDLLLLDLMMPDMDGFELLKLLRQDPRGRELRVLILSARTGHQDQVESLQLGANAYVFKPFSPRDLIRQVHALLADDEEVGTGD